MIRLVIVCKDCKGTGLGDYPFGCDHCGGRGKWTITIKKVPNDPKFDKPIVS